jgi:Cu/Ag efflux protein CusF
MAVQPASAGDNHHSMEGHDRMEAMVPMWTDGEVRKIEKEAGKLTLRHGEVKNLDMRAMTMAWKLKDPAMLDNLKVGDKILFTAEKLNGQFTITGVKSAP